VGVVIMWTHRSTGAAAGVAAVGYDMIAIELRWTGRWWDVVIDGQAYPLGWTDRIGPSLDSRRRPRRLAKKLARRCGARRHRDGRARIDAAMQIADYRWIGDPPPRDHSKIWGHYACGDCGATGVRLWRDCNTFLDYQSLRCRSCTEAHEGRPFRGDSDQCGWSVPAVPTSDGSGFWGYSSVPMTPAAWWRALPDSSTEPLTRAS